eukprot:COSAG06_NODE_30515_length_537_cov_1.883562_2_plen_113_part_01
MTRDTMISMLRTRGVKGRLSKMTKPQLRKLLDGTAPPGAPQGTDKNPDRPKGDLELEPDDQSGGHYYRVTGKTVSDGKHEHGVTTWHSDGRAALSSPKKKAAAKKKKKKVPDI